MRIFLAGATGAVGRRILRQLVADGHEVAALTRRPERAAGLGRAGATPVVADALDAGALRRALVDARPEAVVHQLTDLADGDLAANARLRRVGTRHLVDAAAEAGVRRIVAQSLAFAYAPGDGPATEDVPLDVDAAEPRRTTVRATADLERSVRDAPEWVVLRYGFLYGPDTWFHPTGSRADAARAGELVAGDDVSSFVHVDDAAVAAVAALDWPAGTIVNVCDDEPAPARAWLPAFCAWVGAPPPAEVPPGERHGWARGADNGRARRDLGWTPRHPSWREGFAGH